ncbi:MAG TPA: T9SS type A sorting domain-containing protein [Bacteroidia bacterium]|nr:T9SS type A sorting domain-containing protein [Bacteroidia bacterium]
MKKILLFFVAFSFLLNVQAQVPNSGFEMWSGGIPTNWNTSNILTLATPITQTSPGHSGSSAAKGQAVSFQGQVVAPVLFNAPPGFSVSQIYANLQFWYKANLVGGDIFTGAVIFVDAGLGPLAAGTMDFTANAASFTMASVPVVLGQGGTVATAYVSFSIAGPTGAEPDVNSWFIVDDVTLNGTLTGIEQIDAQNTDILVWPNPADHTININYANANSKDALFSLYNISGQKVMEFTGMQQDVNTLNNGMYFLYDMENALKPTKVLIAH